MATKMLLVCFVILFVVVILGPPAVKALTEAASGGDYAKGSETLIDDLDDAVYSVICETDNCVLER